MSCNHPRPFRRFRGLIADRLSNVGVNLHLLGPPLAAENRLACNGKGGCLIRWRLTQRRTPGERAARITKGDESLHDISKTGLTINGCPMVPCQNFSTQIGRWRSQDVDDATDAIRAGACIRLDRPVFVLHHTFHQAFLSSLGSNGVSPKMCWRHR